jgi:aldehyde dehydrogenase (NAD+)
MESSLKSKPQEPQCDKNRVEQILDRQRQFFAKGKTKDLDFRRHQLNQLRQGLKSHTEEILEALHQDLGKSTFEAYSSEVMLSLEEIAYTLKHLNAWAKPQNVPVRSPILLFSSARIQPEPLGVVLIIAPWNYPVQLAFLPLIGAIAAGNCAIVKPSEIASHTSKVIAKIIQTSFESEYIAAMVGGIETSQLLLEQKFDHIFFTGGTAVGKIVMAAAAKRLTPVTLELGGKSPCIVDRCDLNYAAHKIIWGKCFNAGQTCIAPDYVLVERSLKPDLIAAMKIVIQEFYGEDPKASADYGRIVSDRQFARLTNLLAASQAESSEIVAGGQSDALTRYIAPTIVDCQGIETGQNAKLMEEEIFGPILPILTYETLDRAIEFINSRPKPLALYLFSNNSKAQQQVMHQTSSGSSCVNNLILQSGVPSLPFGGVGDSGIGTYHGKFSFATFSHYKSILYSPAWFNFKWLYPPYQPNLLKWLGFVK